MGVYAFLALAAFLAAFSASISSLETMSFSFFQDDSKTSGFSWEECEGRGAHLLLRAEGVGAGTALVRDLQDCRQGFTPVTPRLGQQCP